MWHLENGGKKEYEYGSRTMTDDDLEIGGRRGGTDIEGELCLRAGVAGANLCIGLAACLKPVRDGVWSAVSKGSTQAQQQSEAGGSTSEEEQRARRGLRLGRRLDQSCHGKPTTTCECATSSGG